jgi:hypothetical protein
VLVYEDDITEFLRQQEDIATVYQAIRTYEWATGAQLNPRKTKALALGSWSAPITLLGIELSSSQNTWSGVRIHHGRDNDSWTIVTNAVRA